MPVKDVKLYICDGCSKQILTPRNGLFLVVSGDPKWVGGFMEHGVPLKADMPTLKPATPKGDNPFQGLGTNQGGGTQGITLCRGCLAAKLGFAPDPDMPVEDAAKPPVTRFGHDDPV